LNDLYADSKVFGLKGKDADDAVANRPIDDKSELKLNSPNAHQENINTNSNHVDDKKNANGEECMSIYDKLR
jgi:hypothetical protein